jgi:hypothetical protein
MSVCTYVLINIDACRGQNMTLDNLGLELQVVVSQAISFGIKTKLTFYVRTVSLSQLSNLIIGSFCVRY